MTRNEPFHAPVRRFVVAAVLLLGVGQACFAADKVGYEPGRIWQVYLTIAADEYAAMQPRFGGVVVYGPQPKQPPAGGREVHRNNFGVDLPWATGAVTIGGETFANVGVRYKGNGTISDACPDGQEVVQDRPRPVRRAGRFHGSKTINLHCGVADPSKCRETLGYALYRAAGVPAPRHVPRRGPAHRPGQVRQRVARPLHPGRGDRQAVPPRPFGTDKGLLMKPEGLRDIEDRGDDWDKYKKPYAPKRDATPEEADRVIAFARLVHKADDAAFRKEHRLVPGRRRVPAVPGRHLVHRQPDSFFGLGHNYYLYLHPKTGQAPLLPVGPRPGVRQPADLRVERAADGPELIRPYAGAHRLTDRLLAMPGMSDRYQALFKDWRPRAFAKDRLLKELDAAEAAMKDLLARDAKAAAARKDAGTPAASLAAKPPALRTFVEKRTASVAARNLRRFHGAYPCQRILPGHGP